MIKLKALPAALIVGVVVLVSGFCLVKWLIKVLRKPPPHPHAREMRELEDEEEPVIARNYLSAGAIRRDRGHSYPSEPDVRGLIWSTNLVDWHRYGTMVGWQIIDPMTNACMFWRWEEREAAE